MKTIKVTREMEIPVDVEFIAEVFCSLDDEAQADFFIKCSQIAEQWGGGYQELQWSRVSNHLKTCECSTYLARNMVRTLAQELDEFE